MLTMRKHFEYEGIFRLAKLVDMVNEKRYVTTGRREIFSFLRLAFQA